MLFNYAKYKAVERIIRELRNPPQESKKCKGIWIQGTSGSGKDYVIRTTLREANIPTYISLQSKWFDNYEYERVIYINDFKPDMYGTYSTILKHLADTYCSTMEVKGGFTKTNHHVLIVSSQYTIAEAFKDDLDYSAIERRFQ